MPHTASAAIAKPTPGKLPPSAAVPWREREFLTLQVAAEIAGISIAMLYRLEADGKLPFRRFAGRTLVRTADFVPLLEGAEAWTASERGAGGRAKRAELARARWQG